MPATIRIEVTQVLQSVEVFNVFHFYNDASSTTADILSEALDVFEDTIVSLWQDWLPQAVTITHLRASSPSFPFPVERDVLIVGEQVVSGALILPPYLPLIVKLGIVGNIVGDTGAPYVGLRPVRSGRKYVSGLTEDFMSVAGYATPEGAMGDAFEAWLEALDNPLTVFSVNWIPVVWSDAVDALGDKPARGVVVAPVVSATPVRFTRLKTRLT